MTLTGIEIDLLGQTRKDFGDAGVVGAHAFHHDPFFVFLGPRPIQRARGLSLFCRAYVSVLGEAGYVLGARQGDGRLVGVAAWVRPGHYPLGVQAQLRQMANAFWALSSRPKALVDGTKYLLAIDKVHPKGELWYLQLLVVDPPLQRHGVGSALLGPVLARADEDGLACYVETQNPDNLPYYRRFGFEVVEELRPVRHGPPLWTMQREPQPPVA
ncbi:MAG TPA: GNAT family N-acetyltransferase [Acidimicrobiales bacterium]|nr:GNAT family N-acetyltransferase [Acidimicrobiales bacterium]